jgi:hypothetical protein
MRNLMTKYGLAVLPMGWVAAAALAAAPATALAGDDYARAAEASGTTAFLAEVFMPGSGYAISTSKDDRSAAVARADYAREAEASGTTTFEKEVFMPSSVHAAEPGAASGEPDEATTETAMTLAHQQWVESIWKSP